MRKINKPDISQNDICDEFEKLKNNKKFESYRIDIENSAINYGNYFEALESLYNFDKEKVREDSEYKEYMKKMYSERFTQKSYSSLYDFYTKIRSAARYCPYCNDPIHPIRQVDHFFPKSKFPSLSLTIDNLVPICADCNENKKEYHNFDKSKMLIHPYFDDFANTPFEFIQCKIIEENPIAFDFSIKKMAVWSEEEFNRVKTHFEMLKLNDLYSVEFTSDFEQFLHEIEHLYDQNLEHSGEKDIKISIEEVLDNKISSYQRSDKKPWYFAGYVAIRDSNWFFDSVFNIVSNLR